MADNKALSDALLQELDDVVAKHAKKWQRERVPPNDAGACLMTAGLHIAARMISTVARIDARGPLGFIEAAHPHMVQQLLENTCHYAGVSQQVEVRPISEPPEALQ